MAILLATVRRLLRAQIFARDAVQFLLYAFAPCPFHTLVLTGENNVFKKRNYQWLRPTGQDERRTAYVAITRDIPKKAKDHFGCPTVEGFEMNYNYDTQFPDFHHWSEDLFPDEILSFDFSVQVSLSVVTLSAMAAHPTWYRVDFQRAEPLLISKPPPELACAGNEKGCWQIVNEQKAKGAPALATPYCDYDRGSGRIVMVRCSLLV